MTLNQGNQKRLKYLIAILIVMVLAALFIFGRNFLWQELVISPIEIAKPEKIEIDFQVFENNFFQELQSFQEISYPDFEIGRTNPFLSY